MKFMDMPWPFLGLTIRHRTYPGCFYCGRDFLLSLQSRLARRHAISGRPLAPSGLPFDRRHTNLFPTLLGWRLAPHGAPSTKPQFIGGKRGWNKFLDSIRALRVTAPARSS